MARKRTTIWYVSMIVLRTQHYAIFFIENPFIMHTKAYITYHTHQDANLAKLPIVHSSICRIVINHPILKHGQWRVLRAQKKGLRRLNAWKKVDPLECCETAAPNVQNSQARIYTRSPRLQKTRFTCISFYGKYRHLCHANSPPASRAVCIKYGVCLCASQTWN